MIQAGDPTGVNSCQRCCSMLCAKRESIILISVVLLCTNFIALVLQAHPKYIRSQVLAKVEKAYTVANLRMRLTAACITQVLGF